MKIVPDCKQDYKPTDTWWMGWELEIYSSEIRRGGNHVALWTQLLRSLKEKGKLELSVLKYVIMLT